MFDLAMKNRGAISIFLIIVLVPMLVVSSIFVDISRIQLAKSVSESSGELTLNTALTNYDAVLKDMYGLFATSQDTDELFENLENYYKQCIESAGVAEADAEDYVGQIMQLLKSESGSDDLLHMDLTSFEVSKPTGGSLANPAVLKSQIVEFMKYRGPINLGTGIFDALCSMRNIKKQSQLVDNKNKFYEQQTGMMEKLEQVWGYIEHYQYSDAYTTYYDGDKWDKCTFPDGKYLECSAERMNECIVPLQTSISYIVRYLYFANTDYSVASSGLDNLAVEYKECIGHEEYSGEWIANFESFPILIEPEEDEKSGSFEDVETSLHYAFAAIQALEKPDELVEQLSQGSDGMTTTEKIKIVVNTKASIGKGYHANIKNLVYWLTELQNAVNLCPESELSNWRVKVNTDEDGNHTLQISGGEGEDILSFVSTQILSHLSTESGHIQLYNAFMDRAHGYWEDTHEIVKNARLYVIDWVQDTELRARQFDLFLDEKIQDLSNAMTVLSEISSELAKTDSEYNKALKAWKSSADDLAGDTMADSDLNEISKLEKVLTVSKVDSLYNRIKNAKESLELVKEQVGQFKVLNVQWISLKDGGEIDYNTLIDLLSSEQKNNIESVVESTNTMQESIPDTADKATYDIAYDDVVEQLQNTILSTPIKVEWEVSEANKNPNLVKEQVELYTWLYNNFYNEAAVKEKYDKGYTLEGYTSSEEVGADTAGKISNGKEDADNAQSEFEEDAKTYNEKEVKQGTEPDREYNINFLPSGKWDDLKSLVGNSETGSDSEALLSTSSEGLSILDQIFGAMDSMATTLRDDLYVVNYIMTMFSYSTYENEISVANGNDPSAFATWYEWNEEDSKYQLRSDFKTKYSNSEQMLLDARTLTKVSINPNSNYLYGEEVEYIIYGEGGTKSSYGTIYMLRFALNTIYAFTDAEINNITTAAATALFGTPPLTPLIPIAKIAMTIGLALAESAYDLYELKSGKEIPLIKNSKTWVMKPSSAAKIVVGEIVTEVGEVVIDEGVELFNDVLEMTNDELQAMISSSEEELGKIVNSAVEVTITEINNYGNQAIQKMVSICNDIRTDAMLEVTTDDDGSVIQCAKGQTPQKIELAISQIEQWLFEQKPLDSESDVVYLAKEAAVSYLVENDGKVIGELFDLMENKSSLDATTLGEELEKKLTAIQTKVNNDVTELIEQGGNALSDFVSATKLKLEEAAQDGAESLKNALRNQVGSVFGTSTPAQSSTNSVVASLLSWSYSDYLQLFLLIAMLASPESVVLRTADVIELNMQQIDGNPGYIEVTTETEVSRLWGLIKYTKTETIQQENEDAFKLENSYTYLNIKATVGVKPLLLAMPLIENTVKNELNGSNWYQIEYEGILGY